MADFVAVLKKTLDGLNDASPQMREKDYEKARLTIASKLAAMNPPPPPGVVDRQKRALEDAIAQIEKEFAPPPKAKSSDPLAELEDVFASLKNPDPAAMLRDSPRARPAPTPAAPAPTGPVAPAQAKPAPQPTPAPPAKPAAPGAGAAAVAMPPPAAAPKPAPAPKPMPAAVLASAKDAPAAKDMPAAKPKAAAPERSSPPPERPTPEPPRPSPAAMDQLFADVPEDDMADADLRRPAADTRPRRKGGGRLALAAVIVAALAAGAYGAWMNRETLERKAGDLMAALGLGSATTPSQPGAQSEPAEDVAAAPATPPEEEAGDEAAMPEEPDVPAATEAAAPVGSQKFTQRLNADGTEVDAGPAGGTPTIGEGTSVAAVTEPPVASMNAPAAAAPPVAAPDPADDAPAAEAVAEDEALAASDASDAPTASEAPVAPDAEAAAPDAPAADAADTPAAATPPAQPAPTTQTAQPAQALPVGQRAIFYEERTNVAEASAEPGSIVWSLVQESPGGDLPPEPAIRGEATIPGKDVQLRMTIRRNADQSLPASHIIEMIFLTPQGFEGGGIDNVLRVSLKGSEQEAGSPLLGIPAKIADGFFLIALNDAKPDIAANASLLGRQSWIDVPVQYKSGRRALFTMEKGIPGTKVFDEALKAWQAAGSG
jgi:hypothetical protein